MEESKKICIGQKDTSYTTYQFNSMLNKLQGVINGGVLEEFGLPFDNEILQDVLAGGASTREKVVKRLNDELFGDFLPVIRREKEKIFNELLQNFGEMVKNVRSLFGDYSFIPAEYFTTDGCFIQVDQQAHDTIADQGKIFIDQPEQIEAWESAKKAVFALQELHDIVSKYGINALGDKGVIEYYDGIEYRPFAIKECHPGGIFTKRLSDLLG